MSFRQRFASWLMADVAQSTPSAQADQPATPINDTVGWSVWNAHGARSTSRQIGRQEALTLPAVLRAVEVLTGIFAMTPMIYYRKLPDGGRERATASPLYSMFQAKPNETQHSFLFREVMLGDMLLSRGFFAYVHRDELFRPVALSRLDPDLAQTLSTWDEKDGHELFFDVSLPNGQRKRLTRADCWNVPGFSRNGLTGIDRIALMNTALSSAISTSEYAARFWENNAEPTVALTLKGKAKPEDKASIRRDWEALHAGPRAKSSTAVLDQEMDIKTISHSNKDSQHIESRTFDVVEVSRVLGIPPHLIFELSRSTNNNIEHQSLELITYHMMPHYERTASAATHAFAEPDHYFEHLPDALLKGDIKSRFEAYGVAIDKGIMNPDEVRIRENMNKRPGGDRYRVGSGSQIEGAEAPASQENAA